MKNLNVLKLPLVLGLSLTFASSCLSVKNNSKLNTYKNNISQYLITSSNEINMENAIDNDYSTYRESDVKENAFLLLDFQEIRQITSVTQIFKDYDIWYFTIEGSIDGVNFYEIYEANKGEVGNVFQESCDTFAQYIKLNIYKSEKGFNPSSIEFFVNNNELSKGVNQSLNKKSGASSFASYYASDNAFDGNSGSYYCASSGNYEQWLSVELGEISYINSIELTLVDYGEYNFEIEVRNQDGNWEKIVNQSVYSGIQFEFKVGKFIDAIVYRVFSGPGWANVLELKTYGFESLNGYQLKNDTLEFDGLTYVSLVNHNNELIEYSLDGETYKLVNEEDIANGIVCKFLKSSSNEEFYGYQLINSLLDNLDGTCSDYDGHDNLLSNVTLNNNDYSKIWKSSRIGEAETIEFDLDRESIISDINLVFPSEGKHKFTIEISVDDNIYQTYFDYTNNNDIFKEITLTKKDVFNAKKIRLNIYPNANEYASLSRLKVNGLGNQRIENWWEDQSGVIRYYPKLQKITLNEITNKLDWIKYAGFKVIELHQPYEGLADIWAGLGGTNNYKVDPTIGTLDDLETLLDEAHKRGLYVFMFGNVGYGKNTADYFKKACKDYALGINSKERNWFVFSDVCVDPTKWFYSDIANAYYYGYWGENGQIPTFNFENKERQDEVYNYIDFWSSFGIDGIALDAPDVYYFGKENASEVTYQNITKTLIKKNLFALPEGSGDKKFISSYYYNCIQNYGMSSWGGNAFSVGLNNAMTHKVNDTDNVIKTNRDEVVSLGGVSMATMNFEDNYMFNSGNDRVLEAALVTSTGHLAFLHSGSSNRIGQDILETWDEDIKNKVFRLFGLQNSLSSLNPTGHRYKLINTNDQEVYSFVKKDMRGNSYVLPIFNYGSNDKNIQININNSDLKLDDGTYKIYDSFAMEPVEVTLKNGIMSLTIKKNSYMCLIMR